MENVPPSDAPDNVYHLSSFRKKTQTTESQIITPAYIQWREFFDVSYPTDDHARLLASPYVGYAKIAVDSAGLNCNVLQQRFVRRMNPRPARLEKRDAMVLACYKAFTVDSSELHAARMIAAELKTVLGRHCVRVVTTDVIKATDAMLDGLQLEWRRHVKGRNHHLSLLSSDP